MANTRGFGLIGRPRRRKRTTSITLSADDLSALARLLSVGQSMVQTRFPVVARLKAAMTRLGVPIPPVYSPRFLGQPADDNHAATSVTNSARTAAGERWPCRARSHSRL